RGRQGALCGAARAEGRARRGARYRPRPRAREPADRLASGGRALLPRSRDAALMDVCIALALSSALVLRLPSPVTLAWQHSVEHFALEEDWVATPQGLQLAQVRTEGLGAGVDLPA